MDKYEKMIERVNERYNYSEIEKQKIISLLDYCHATDVRMTDRNMYEVFFVCDAVPGKEITTSFCDDECVRSGCSNCTVAEDAECVMNQE